MSEPSHVAHLIEVYAAAKGASPHTVARKCSGDGRTYARLTNGHDITTGRAQRILQWFSKKWPPDLPWPHDIHRPAPSEAAVTRAEPDGPADAAEGESASGSGAFQPDPLAEVERFKDEIDAAKMAGRWDDATALHARMMRAATRLGPDGLIASPRALIRALNSHKNIYKDVCRRYRAGRAGHRVPQPGSEARRMLGALQMAGDKRFHGTARVA